MKKSLSLPVLLLLLVAICLSLLSCAAEKLDEDGTPVIEPSKEDSQVVMTVNGFEVTYDLFRYFYLNHKAENLEGDELNRAVEDSIRNIATVYEVAEKIGLSKVLVTSSVTNSVIDLYESNDRSTKKYTEALAAMHLTDRTFRLLTEAGALRDEIYASFPTSDLADTSDETVMEVLLGDGCIVVKQILIEKTEGADESALKAKAEEALAKAKAGEDFKKLTEKYSDDLSVRNVSEGYYLTGYQFLPEFENAAFTLEIGEISDIVESDAGYSIILRCEKDEDYIETHFDELKDLYIDSVYQKTLEEYAASLPAPKYTDFYGTLRPDEIK